MNGAWAVGEQVEVMPGYRKATIGYIGPVVGLKGEEWFGVRYDDPVGKGDGTRDGKRYFDCQPNHGGFLSAKALRKANARKSAMEDRMKSRDATRMVEKQKKQEATAINNAPQESGDRFWKAFHEKEEHVRTTLENTTPSSIGEPETQSLRDRFEELKFEVHQMQKEAARASIFLANYDQRQTALIVATLTREIEAKEITMMPRQKFSFSARRQRKLLAEHESRGDKTSIFDSATTKEEPKTKQAEVYVPDFGFRFDGKENETLRIDPGQLSGEDGKAKDGCLSNLKNCTVLIRDVTSAIRVDKLEDCRIYCGPIAGSVHLQYCKRCVFVIACRQTRIHDSYDCDYYLHVASNPIFEDCSRLRFGQYALAYPELPAQMIVAGLAGVKNQWDQVDDFKWLRQQQSPNWRRVEQGEEHQMNIEDISMNATCTDENGGTGCATRTEDTVGSLLSVQDDGGSSSDEEM
jgi:hypothetical protein